MKVEIIEKKREPQPTPFVVGGVYCQLGRYHYVLVRDGDRYALVDANSGGLCTSWYDEPTMTSEFKACSIVYVPNAKLVVEVDA